MEKDYCLRCYGSLGNVGINLGKGFRPSPIWSKRSPPHQILHVPPTLHLSVSFFPPSMCPNWSKNSGPGFHNKALLPRSLETGFHCIIWGTGASTPRIWYADMYAKPSGRFQPIKKIGYEAGNWPSSSSLRRETAAATSSG